MTCTNYNYGTGKSIQFVSKQFTIPASLKPLRTMSGFAFK